VSCHTRHQKKIDETLGFRSEQRVHVFVIHHTTRRTAMTSTQASNLETLGNKLGTAALTTLIRLCPEIRTASDDLREAACAAMRAKSQQAIDELLDDGQACPWMAETIFASAVMTLVNAGIKVLRGA
jgi:hypothetical protein